MADIFLKNDVVTLLTGKRIAFIGDSNVRHLYKDLVWLIKTNTIVPNAQLRKKMEGTFQGDKLVHSGELTAGRNYEENRKFSLNGIEVEYIFISRCLHEKVKIFLENIRKDQSCSPDIIVMNSTLWDITRWGPKGVDQFKDDLLELMKLLSDVLPQKTMFVWTTALPPGKKVRKGSLLIKQVEFLEFTVRFDVMEANLYARNVVTEFGYDLLDLHYHLRMQVHRRHPDGLHYNGLSTRLLTNLLLTHIALSWGRSLPGNINNTLLTRYRSMVDSCCPFNEPGEGMELRNGRRSPLLALPVQQPRMKAIAKRRKRPPVHDQRWNTANRSYHQAMALNYNQNHNYSLLNRLYHDMQFNKFAKEMNDMVAYHRMNPSMYY